MFRLNERSAAIVARLADDALALQVEESVLPNGAHVVDAGLGVPGSLEAGRLFSEACLAGLGRVQIRQLQLDDAVMPGVEVSVSQPPLACLAAQYAGWAVDVPASGDSPRYRAMGSGPARALHGHEPIFETVRYRETGKRAVLALETRQLPTANVAAWVAEKCGVPADGVHLLVAPTASIVGSVQVAARIVETGLHKMVEVGFDVSTVQSGFGTCPLAPVAGDDLTAIGRTNDAVLFGGRVWYTVRTDDASIERVIEQMPSSASSDYGVPFRTLFQRYGGDFYKIDPGLFSPAQISITNGVSGKTFTAGTVNVTLLRESFFA